MAKLNEKAMLIHLRVSQWSGQHKDSSVSSHVCDEYTAESDAGSWWTHYVPKQALAEIRFTANACKGEWVRQTLPWMSGGLRIILATKVVSFSAKMRPLMDNHQKAVDSFLTDSYPEILANAPKRLGKLKNGKTMPSVGDLRGRFGIHIDLLPIPDIKDFRVGLVDEEMKEVRQQVEESYKNLTQTAMMEVWGKLLQMLEKIHTTLDKPGKKFKDSLLGNLKEFCIQLPNLNLTEDPALDKLRKEVEETLVGFDCDVLRHHKSTRSKAAKAAKDLIAKTGQYMKR